MVRDDGDPRAAAVGGVVRAAGLCGAHRLTVRGGARSRQGKAVRLPVFPRAGRSTYRSGQFGKYTGSRIQRVWLQRTPGYYEQFFRIEIFDCNVKKVWLQRSPTYNEQFLLHFFIRCKQDPVYVWWHLVWRHAVFVIQNIVHWVLFTTSSVITSIYLPPATKLRQDNVLHLCHSVHRGGGGLCPSMHHESHDQGGVSVWEVLCTGGSLSGGISVRETSVQ